ncbi:MAG: amidohydrolase family protein [Limnochordia bacterium]|jgi:predicted TIM-barrel fold metal-dependent hydrolase
MARIDMHTHLLARGPEPLLDELATAERLARSYGIARLVLLGNLTSVGGPNPTPQDIMTINTHTLKVMALYPDLYIGFCYLNPAHPRSFVEEEMERCIAKGGMRGIKLWIAVKATDDCLDRIMDWAERHGILILHHAWYKQTVYSYQESTPAEIAQLARRWPHVTVVMAHLCGGSVRGVLDVADLPNVLIDTSGSQPEAGLVEYAVRRLGANRVVYGSDWPLRDFGTQIGRVLGADLDPADEHRILYANASRVLGLEETR